MYVWDTGTWVWMAVSMIVIAVALAVVVLVAARGAFHGSEDTAGAKPAATILDERFARGEIEREEYEERRRVLTRID
jgi:putative membrane protein